MSLSPLSPVTDYQSMLNRIFWFTSGAALAAVWLLRTNLPWLDVALKQVDFSLEFGGDKILPVPGGYLLPALAVGLCSRIFRIHGKLADWLGIRERFDLDVIIGELAHRTGVELEGYSDEQLVSHRHDLMRGAFYPFVSGRDPQIDETLIYRARDLWSWLWIGLEATTIFVATGMMLVATGAQQPGITVMLTTLAFAAVGLPAVRNECRRHAVAQVREIVRDPVRAELVRLAFHATLSQPFAARLAA
ncbi:hypothetical protein [Adhaeretor mobilis]|uniref:Uncharacterized protein n=1 Tax=Adhaeretor mobilis TaxID=1930276 RepID=A0A517MYP9_9BACT|nr:hypothetical protein [Adhaeretor mobilis]QDS99973.1 hypothetical protein HG15A2_33090 [Adhaeretor mobilis]